jgi:hypothetical protein
LVEFVDDLDLFEDLLRDFTEFLFESEQHAMARIEPAAEIEKSGESREDALSRADEIIHDLLDALDSETILVPFLAPFLTNQWRDVIAYELQKSVDSQSDVQLAISTMGRLIWSTQPKTTSEQRRELVANLPAMVKQINQSLDAIEWDAEPRATFTRRLITTHTLAIRLKQQSVVADAICAEAEEKEGKAAIAQLDERLAAARQHASQISEQDAFDAMAQGFKSGMWFDAELSPGVRGPTVLAWVSPMRTRLLFTNREGFDAFVRSEQEVSAMLRMGKLKVLDRKPIVGRALEQILRGQEEQAHPQPELEAA